MRRRLVFLTFAQLITSTQFLQRMNQIFLAMKILSAVSVHMFVGMQRSWFTVLSALVWESADTSQPMHLLHPFTKSALTTSSVGKIMQVAEIKSSSKVTHLLECIHVHFLKDVLVRTNSMDSAKNFHTKVADSRHIHTHG